MRKVGHAKKLSYGAKRQILDRYREGESMQSLGKSFGVSRQAIFQLLRSRGVATRPRHPHPEQYGRESGPGPGDWTNQDRNEAGITVTLRRQDTHEFFSMHIAGLRGEALQYLADLIDRSGIDWRVLSYSTPETIVGDLKQRRAVQPESTTRRAFAYLGAPEANALGRIGRLDLLDPDVDRGERPRPKR
jgi:hypothetical protein